MSWRPHWSPLSQTCPWPRLWLCTDWKFWTDSFVLSKVIHFFPKAHIFHYYMHGQDISALTLCNFWYFCLMFVHWCFLQNLFCKYLILWCYLIFWSSKIVFSCNFCISKIVKILTIGLQDIKGSLQNGIQSLFVISMNMSTSKVSVKWLSTSVTSGHFYVINFGAIYNNETLPTCKIFCQNSFKFLANTKLALKWPNI